MKSLLSQFFGNENWEVFFIIEESGPDFWSVLNIYVPRPAFIACVMNTLKKNFMKKQQRIEQKKNRSQYNNYIILES